MCFTLPPVRVKQEYKGRVRIAWCHNVGTNPIQQAIFKEDDDTYQTWDNYWADIYFQFYQDQGAGKRENHNIGVGNVKCLEEWTEYLPSYPIDVDQPWFYSMDHALSFPIFYKNSQTRAEHRYTFRRKLVDLLRVQILGKDHKWKNTTRKVHQYLDITPSATLKLPELWGRYAYITEPEIKWYKCKQTRVFYTRDVEICDTPNPNKYKSTAEIGLHCTNPCLAFFWVAENLDATANHNYSNYTTDVNDLYSGWDPIKTTTLKYGTTVRLDNMPSHHFSIAEPRKHFPSAPSERGYHGYSYAWDSTSYHGDIGIVFANMNARLQCRIANNNIFTNIAYEEDDDDEEEDEIADAADGDQNKNNGKKHEDTELADFSLEENSPSFVTRSRLLVVRKFTISAEADDKYKFTVR
ncbi:Divergent major capsid protein [uncultured virus]|nr:Divergent major capsid protein [uncultured virus]